MCRERSDQNTPDAGPGSQSRHGRRLRHRATAFLLDATHRGTGVSTRVVAPCDSAHPITNARVSINYRDLGTCGCRPNLSSRTDWDHSSKLPGSYRGIRDGDHHPRDRPDSRSSQRHADAPTGYHPVRSSVHSSTVSDSGWRLLNCWCVAEDQPKRTRQWEASSTSACFAPFSPSSSQSRSSVT